MEPANGLIVGATPVVDCTSFGREDEIATYLMQQTDDEASAATAYCVIDDMDLVRCRTPGWETKFDESKFVRCDATVGLTQADALRAIDILLRQTNS
jgi:hypothetical protein